MDSELVAVIDDDIALRQSLVRLIKSEGYQGRSVRFGRQFSS
jgi:FixJ family two-component response regulator